MRRIASGGPFEEKIGYSRVVVADGWIMVSGCTGADPQSGTFSPDITEQCRHTLDRVREALESAGANFGHVVRVSYMLKDREEFEPCWAQLRAAFGDTPPAATMIEAGMIRDEMKIEIEVTAKFPEDGSTQT